MAIFQNIYGTNLNTATNTVLESDSNNTNLTSPAKEALDLTFESPYGQVKVVDKNSIRRLLINGGVMGEINLLKPKILANGWSYISCMESAFKVKSDIKEVLVIGLGAGLLPKKVLMDFNDVHVDAVDINPTVIDVAKKHFDVVQSLRLSIIEDDGRAYLQRTTKKYDLITIDAFHFKENYKLPTQLVTQEFFEEVKSHLNKGGIMSTMYIVNKDQYIKSNFHKAEYKTINTVFNNTLMFDCV